LHAAGVSARRFLVGNGAVVGHPWWLYTSDAWQGDA
jgi:hypothetical protein